MKHTKIAGFDIIKAEHLNAGQARDLAFAANAEKVGGFADWMLPDTQTLRALALISPEKIYCWSSSPDVDDRGSVWLVSFGTGSVSYSGLSYSYFHVRLVRTSQCLAIGQAGQIESLRQAGINVEGGAA